MVNGKRGWFVQGGQLVLTLVVAAGASAGTTWALGEDHAPSVRQSTLNDGLDREVEREPVRTITAVVEDGGVRADITPPSAPDEDIVTPEPSATLQSQREEVLGRLESNPIDPTRQRAVSDYFWELEHTQGVRGPSELRCAGELCRAEYRELSERDRGAVVDAVRSSYPGQFMFERQEDEHGGESLTFYMAAEGSPLFNQDGQGI